MILEILQIVLVIILVVLVLLQSPGTNILSGFGGSQQGLSSIFSVNSSSSIMSKITAIVAAAFMVNTLLLAGFSARDMKKKLIAEEIEQENQEKSNAPVIPFENE